MILLKIFIARLLAMARNASRRRRDQFNTSQFTHCACSLPSHCVWRRCAYHCKPCWPFARCSQAANEFLKKYFGETESVRAFGVRVRTNMCIDCRHMCSAMWADVILLKSTQFFIPFSLHFSTSLEMESTRVYAFRFMKYDELSIHMLLTLMTTMPLFLCLSFLSFYPCAPTSVSLWLSENDDEHVTPTRGGHGEGVQEVRRRQ